MPGILLSRAYFVDTGIWKAHLDRGDQWHGLASAILRELAELRTPLVTTDVVILEFMTLARNHGVSLGKIEDYVQSILASSQVEYTIADDLISARRLIQKYSAIPFSGFDASSVAVMERMHIIRALTIDDEFIRCSRFIEVRPTLEERKTVLE